MVSIAQDIQGPEAPRPWLEKAGATFTTLLDRSNAVGKAYNLKYVPVGILLDEDGRLVRPVGPVDINDAAFAAEVEEWVGGGAPAPAWAEQAAESTRGLSTAEAEADGLFQQAVELVQRGDKEAALEHLRRASALDRDNWLIRKQLWALEVPGAFYGGAVDYDWQKRRIAAEDAARG